MRRVVALSVALGALWIVPSANAAISSVFGNVTCSVNGSDLVRECGTGHSTTISRSTTESWDGTPIDVNVAFPPDPSPASDGPYPLIMVFHGYGGDKIGFGTPGGTDAMRRWTSRGYAVFSMTDRGFHESCGSSESRAADPTGCADGYVRLMDDRYEVRDAQFFAGELADEGLIEPQNIGATGGSYGGGMSMALAALRDRTMLQDGPLVPWKSPNGTAMRIAAATPEVPWTDLAYSLTPNGRNLDFVADSPYRGRLGVMKLSFINGLYHSGELAPGFYAPEGTDPSADLTGWRARLLAGEPYDGDPNVQAIFDEITAHHSSYYIDHSKPPAPLMISNGFTDDLFPVDEALRFYNRTETQYPDAPIALNFGDFGHQRAAGKSDVEAAIAAREDAWMDFYVKGAGPRPPNDVAAFTETCPGSAPSGGPFTTTTWAKLARGEVRFSSKVAHVISPTGGSDAVSAKFNPAPFGTTCATAPGAEVSGVATYRLPTATGGGYTLLGSPTIVATIKDPTPNSQLAARLLDVDTHDTVTKTDDTETLVARQLYRPKVGTGRRVFQLHPGAWHFDNGHVPKLELLPRDSDAGQLGLGGYGRPSNGQGKIIVSNLRLTLPVHERPGAARGAVKRPAQRVAPCSYRLATEFAGLGRVASTLAPGKLRLRHGAIAARVSSVPGEFACKVDVSIKGTERGTRFRIAHGSATIPGGKTGAVKLRLTRRARRALLGDRALVATRVIVRTEAVGRSIVKRSLELPAVQRRGHRP
jgi:hypothetical protein